VRDVLLQSRALVAAQGESRRAISSNMSDESGRYIQGTYRDTCRDA
jgi:hypothetical protein